MRSLKSPNFPTTVQTRATSKMIMVTIRRKKKISASVKTNFSKVSLKTKSTMRTTDPTITMMMTFSTKRKTMMRRSIRSVSLTNLAKRARHHHQRMKLRLHLRTFRKLCTRNRPKLWLRISRDSEIDRLSSNRRLRRSRKWGRSSWVHSSSRTVFSSLSLNLNT